MSRPSCPALCHLLWPDTPDYHTTACRATRAEEARVAQARPTRDEYGLKLAEAAALMADCTRRKVGAAIVHPTTHQVISLGYNGLASGKPGCLTEGACPRGLLTYSEQVADTGYESSGCRAIHAEVNAILWGGGRPGVAGATMYVTDEPCFGCSVVIEGAGIARVIVPTKVRGGIIPLEVNFS